MEREPVPVSAGGGAGGARNGPGSSRRGLLQAVLALLALAAGSTAAWFLLTGGEDVGRRPAPERAARLVQVVSAEPASHTVTVTAWGQVIPARSLTVRPRVGGRVAVLGKRFEPGEVLAAGELLVQIDPRDYELAVARAQSELTRAQADLALEQGRQAVARREYELLGQDVNQAERDLILRQPQLKTARAAVKSAEADLADARLALERTRVEAPYDALVLSREVSVGSEVATSTNLAELAGVATWWVELQVPVGALQWIRFPDGDTEGSTVTLDYEGVWPGDTTRTGRALRLRGDLEEQGRLARVLVAVDDPLARQAANAGKPRMLLGAFMKAEVRGRAIDASVALEPQWLHTGNTVWIMDDGGELVMRPVDVAYRDARRVLVTGGIRPGERIVTSQLSAPVEGMPLRVQAGGASAESVDGD